MNIIEFYFNIIFSRFIAEESTATASKPAELTDSPTWLIDPIDGTTNFVHGFSECCISMGLTVNKQLELGLIYNPSTDQMFTAIRGAGAFLNGSRLMKASNVTGKYDNVTKQSIFAMSLTREAGNLSKNITNTLFSFRQKKSVTFPFFLLWSSQHR